ncbi:thiamine biosynthesis protein ThiC [Kitasatospora sp. NPDC017646]
MEISKSITELYGDKAVVTSDVDAEALEGMKVKSEEFKAQGNLLHLPLAD